MSRAPTLPNESRQPDSRLGAWLIGLVALFLAGAYFTESVLLIPDAMTVGQATMPWTDGAEYLDAAVSLHRDASFSIHVGGEAKPSRYPISFSLLTAGALAVGVDPASAPYRVNQAAGLGLLVLMTVLIWRHLGPLEAGLGALILATLPAFVVLCRSPLSEITASLLVLAAAASLFAYSRSGTVSRGVWGALLLALATGFRLSNLLLFALIPAAVLARRGLAPAARVRHLVQLSGAAVIGMVPLFLVNLATLGHPFKSGYGYWAPSWSADKAFHPRFVVGNLRYEWQELLQREEVFTTANLYGTGSYVGPAFVLLALLGLTVVGVDRLGYFAAAGGFYYGLMKLYFFTDARLLFPLFVLAVPVVAAGLGRLWRVRARRPVVATLGACLLVAAVAGLPAASGSTSETLALLDASRQPSSAYVVTRQLSRLNTRTPRLVLTDIPPPYVHAVSEPGTLVAPLYDDHLFRFNPRVFGFGHRERRELVSESLASGRPVWAATHRHDIRLISAAFPPPEGYAWETVSASHFSGLARLVDS